MLLDVGDEGSDVRKGLVCCGIEGCCYMDHAIKT